MTGAAPIVAAAATALPELRKYCFVRLAVMRMASFECLAACCVVVDAEYRMHPSK